MQRQRTGWSEGSAPPGAWRLRSLAVIVSAAAFIAAFPPFDLGRLAWVALVPLFVAADRLPPRGAFWLGYAWGIVALGGVLWWMATFGPLVWLLGALFLGVFPALALGAAAWADRGHTAPVAALRLTVFWTAVEFLRSLGPLGFPWALLGESQHRALMIGQIASVVGVYGVTFLVALTNAALAVSLTRRHPLAALVIAGVAASATLIWGAAALRQPVLPPGGAGSFVAAVVQPDYAFRLQWDPQRAQQDLDLLARLTHEAASRGAVLVVWPETASPTDIPGDPATLATIASWVRRDHVSLIASSLEGGLTNSVFSFAPDGVFTGRYDKRHLVPFAEFGELAGRSADALPTPRGGVGVTICFESTFPDLSRRSVLAGADLLAVLTNDAWFDGRVAPAQHAAIAPFRAIEEGRYLLRAANSGESMIIDPHGRILATLPLAARGVLSARVAPRRELTPFARYGFLFGWATVFVGALALLPRAVSSVASPGEIPAGAPGLVRLLWVSLLPLAAAFITSGLSGGASGASAAGALSVPMLAVLATTIVLSLDRRDLDLGLGLRLRAFLPALASGLAVVAGVTLVVFRAFSAHGTAPLLTPPPGGWVLGTAAQILVVGLALEWWLRGLVFAAVSAWKGWRVAVVWAALLGAASAAPLGAEAMVWGLFSGIAFGLIRARWRHVPALAIAHGAGNVLLGFTLPYW